MELVAIYIERYKSINQLLLKLNSNFIITKQDYNFELRGVAKKHDYDKGIVFSLLLGQNGVGKTTILDFFQSIYSSDVPEGFLLFSDNEYYYALDTCIDSQIQITKSDKSVKKITAIKDVKLITLVINNIFDINKFAFNTKTLNYQGLYNPSTNALLSLSRKKVLKQEISREMDFIENNYEFLEKMGSPTPSFQFRLYSSGKRKLNSIISNKLKKEHSIQTPDTKAFFRHIHENNGFKDELIYLKKNNISEDDFDLRAFRDLLFNGALDTNLQNNDDLLWPIFHVLLSDICWKAVSRTKLKSTTTKHDLFITLLVGCYIDSRDVEGKIINFYESMKLAQYTDISDIVYSIEDSQSLIDKLSESLLNNSILLTEYSDGFGFHINDSELAEEFIFICNRLNDFIIDDTVFGWSGISSGESAKLKIFSRLYHSILIHRKKGLSDFLIIMDEIDLYLHPEWQRSLFAELIEFTKFNAAENESFQYIISSHSPIIASDFLPENIIKLSKVNNRICVDNNNSGFGTSISELFFDNFTLASTIGSYSRKVLNDIYDKAKRRVLTNSDKELIEKIGDKDVKNALKDLAVDKN